MSQSPAFPTFNLPQHAEVHISRVDVEKLSELPTTGKHSVIVYHRRTKSFYAATTSNPQDYFKRLLSKMASMDEGLPGVLRTMANIEKIFDYAFCNIRARGEVEYAMLHAGYKRAHTPQGSLVTSTRVIYAVHDPLKKITRYISCDEHTSHEGIVKKANRSFVDWLTRDVFDNLGIRFAMRRDLKEILESHKQVLRLGTTHISEVPKSRNTMLKYQRREVDRLNDMAAKEYLANKREAG